MNEQFREPVHWSFWVIVVLALIWDIGGCMAYMAEFNAEAMAEQPESYQNLVATRPAWATAAFAVAVWGSALGCLLLLARKAIAFWLFVASFVGIVVQFTYNFALSGIELEVTPGSAVLTVMIPVIGIFLIWYTKYAEKKGWVS